MGLTETGAQILSNPLPPEERKIGSPGIGYGNEIAIAGPDLAILGPDIEGEILVRGSNHPHIGSHCAMTADAVHMAVAEHTQQPGLQIKGHVADFIQEEGTTVALLELADALLFTGQRVIPAALNASGYMFKHTTLESAFRSLLSK